MDMTEKNWLGFIKLIKQINDEKTLSQLLDLFLTAEEKSNIAMRYSIVKLLMQNEKPQRQIAEELNVSIAKITRGSNELKRTNKKFLDYLKSRL